MLESLLKTVAGPQDCCKTNLLHALLRFYFSLGKTLKVVFTEAYLEPSQTSMM